MLWKEKLKKWENGEFQKYPNNINMRFFYKTTACDKKLNNIYDEKFIESKLLNSIEQNFMPFINYIKNSKNKYVTSFKSIRSNTMLIIPIPIIDEKTKKYKNYTTIKDFIDNADIIQQKKFWKEVTKEIKKMHKMYDVIYINTHGLGVYYFHLRLDINPIYY